MSIPVEAAPSPPAEAPPRPAGPSAYTEHRLSVGRYLKMVDAGVFGDGEPIFLWRGRLVEKMTKGADHSNSLTELYRLIVEMRPGGFHVRQEQPMRIVDDGMPEPDLMIVRGSTRDYPRRAPTAQDVALVVEVAGSSLGDDSGEVLQTYAAQAIPAYWIVNLPAERVDVYTDPAGTTYRSRRSYLAGERVPVVLDGREVGSVAVDEILP